MGIACVQAHHRIFLWNTRQPDMLLCPETIRSRYKTQPGKKDSPERFPARITIYEIPVNAGAKQKAGKGNDRPENPL